MNTQLSLHMPYPPGHCEQIKWKPDLWPKHIKDTKGCIWLVLHVGGAPFAHSPAVFCCHKPKTVEQHTIKDTEAFYT